MAYFKDQTQYQINLSDTPKRIISIVPSQTELLHYFGLEKEVIGITKFCIHPKEWFQTKERIGGTKKLNIEKIRELKPDLILGNKEENTKEDIELLRSEFPVWLSDIDSLTESFDMIQAIGEMTNKDIEAEQLIKEIQSSRGEVKVLNASVLYFIWNEPMMTAGKNTFIDSMLSEAGFVNVLEQNRYPTLSEGDLRSLNPSFIFLSSEPFPFNEEHREAYQDKFPNSKIVLVDGELFSWYGSRLLKSFDYFRKLNEELQSI